jgi:hypothetical protein
LTEPWVCGLRVPVEGKSFIEQSSKKTKAKPPLWTWPGPHSCYAAQIGTYTSLKSHSTLLKWLFKQEMISGMCFSKRHQLTIADSSEILNSHSLGFGNIWVMALLPPRVHLHAEVNTSPLQDSDFSLLNQDEIVWCASVGSKVSLMKLKVWV